jgi:hypothetical protein
MFPMSVPSQESESSCIYVLGVSILPLSMIFFWIFKLFPQCGILCFSFYPYISFIGGGNLSAWRKPLSGTTYLVSGPNGLQQKMLFNGENFVDPTTELSCKYLFLFMYSSQYCRRRGRGRDHMVVRFTTTCMCN